ncbi:hypothetical protein BD779DRAFT_644855 [Infundibulicybe gibba]|nr:hypothetical protein BD779DRAFT_644855 [Infundibulicybe gibba]
MHQVHLQLKRCKACKHFCLHTRPCPHRPVLRNPCRTPSCCNCWSQISHSLRCDRPWSPSPYSIPTWRLTDHDGYVGCLSWRSSTSYGGCVWVTEGSAGYLRVEVVVDGNDEGRNQNEGQREDGNDRLSKRSAGPRNVGDDEEEKREGESLEVLDFMDVLPADGAQQPEQPPSMASSNTFTKQPRQGIFTFPTKPTIPNPRASPSAASLPASASDSPVPNPSAPPPVTPLAVGPPDDPTNFAIYISGPNSAYETAFVTCSTHPVSEVLLTARLHFSIYKNFARLMMKCPARGLVLCPLP